MKRKEVGSRSGSTCLLIYQPQAQQGEWMPLSPTVQTLASVILTLSHSRG